MTELDDSIFNNVSNASKRQTIQMRLDANRNQLFEAVLNQKEAEAVSAVSEQDPSMDMTEMYTTQIKTLSAKVAFLEAELDKLPLPENPSDPVLSPSL